MAFKAEVESMATNAVKMGLTDNVWAYISKGYYLTLCRAADPSYKVNFYSFVESFSDSYASNFQQDPVFGRTDPLQHYQNTQRTIAMSFALVSYNIDTARKNLNDVKGAIQLLYPGYTKHAGQKVYKSAPIIGMRYINLVQEKAVNSNLLGYLPGTISSFTHTPDLEFGVYEADGAILPKVIRLSFTFNPLHQNVLGFQDGEFIDASNLYTYPYSPSGEEIMEGTPFQPGASTQGSDPEALNNYIAAAENTQEEKSLYSQFTQAAEDDILGNHGVGKSPWKSSIFD